MFFSFTSFSFPPSMYKPCCISISIENYFRNIILYLYIFRIEFVLIDVLRFLLYLYKSQFKLIIVLEIMNEKAPKCNIKFSNILHRNYKLKSLHRDQSKVLDSFYIFSFFNYKFTICMSHKK